MFCFWPHSICFANAKLGQPQLKLRRSWRKPLPEKSNPARTCETCLQNRCVDANGSSQFWKKFAPCPMWKLSMTRTLKEPHIQLILYRVYVNIYYTSEWKTDPVHDFLDRPAPLPSYTSDWQRVRLVCLNLSSFQAGCQTKKWWNWQLSLVSLLWSLSMPEPVKKTPAFQVVRSNHLLFKKSKINMVWWFSLLKNKTIQSVKGVRPPPCWPCQTNSTVWFHSAATGGNKIIHKNHVFYMVWLFDLLKIENILVSERGHLPCWPCRREFYSLVPQRCHLWQQK